MSLNIISDAIRHRRRLILDYYPGCRIIEPHTLGISREGNHLLRAYQVSGVSDSGEHAQWKLFRLDKVRAANDNGESFVGPRQGYRRGDPIMKLGIISEL